MASLDPCTFLARGAASGNADDVKNEWDRGAKMSIYAQTCPRIGRWESWPPPGRVPDGDFDVIKGIIVGSGLAILLFWLPLAVAVVHTGH
jgi:hypothetical protein